MRTTLNFLGITSMLFALVFTSCKKDDLAELVIPEATTESSVVAGENGNDGSNGTDGSNGSDGTDGSSGTDGSNGSDGTDGEDGGDGTDGTNGTDGEDGTDGTNGTDGEDGADGTDGTNGTNGEPGADGENGEDGEDGNANVIASEWIDSDYGLALVTSTSFDITDDRFTQDILDSAVILAYGELSTGTVLGIPYVSTNKSYYFSFAIGRIRFLGRSVDRVTPERFTGPRRVRYVIIPSNVAGKSSNLDFSKMSYEEVINHFGLAY